ncbi:MAG: RagB/SusD family nutrient uptake outer membrane protein, partial [Bacteroidales bacterium]|nr:RagB/SusD family nutrient uptake outer membrane protein [Bacteroidales bacterium]
MKKNMIPLCMTALLLSACNDKFLEKYPVTTPTEITAFKTYDNFRTYSWNLYNTFESSDYVQTLYDRAIKFNAEGDLLAGYLTSAADNDTDNSRRDRTVTTPSSGGGWDYSYIRAVNIMLQNIDQSEMTGEDKLHWRAVGYFFFCWRYAELISRFGDVYWVDHVLKEDVDRHIIYGARSPRKTVADSILARLQYAERYIKENGEGTGSNTINKACVQALISRFCLFEGTWRRYHQLGDEVKYLQECVRASQALRKTFPGIDNNFDALLTSRNLGARPGTILYKEYSRELQMGNVAQRYERSTSTYYAMHRATTDMYLVKSNGLPVTNAANVTRPDTDMYDEFRDRDPRLLMTVAPPYSQGVALNYGTNAAPAYPFPPLLSGGKYRYNSEANYSRPGLDSMEYAKLLEQILPDNLSKRLPAYQFQGNAMIWSIPNFPSSPATQFRSKTGYICWRNYALWDYTLSVIRPDNTSDNQSESHKPILFMEEILLNEAEALFELGQFTQTAADETVNRLRRRTTVNMPDMDIAVVNASTDPSNPADRVTPGRDPSVDPLLWEIRRERMVELMGLGFGFADIRRWKKGAWFYNRPIIGVKMDKQYYYKRDANGAPVKAIPTWVNNLP